MKKILMTALVLVSATTWAAQESMTCTTEQGSKMLIVYESYPASIISLSINGIDRTNEVKTFGTSGGTPTFVIKEFPKTGMWSSFGLNPDNAGYTVTKNGMYSGKDHSLECMYTTAKKAAADTTGF